MLALLLTLLSSGAPSVPAKARAPANFNVATVTTERVVLTGLRQIPSWQHDAFRAQVLIAGSPSELKSVRQALSRRPSLICPQVSLEKDQLVLTCRTRLLEVWVNTHEGQKVLDLRELRGLPWRGDQEGPPFPSYVGVDEKIKGPCPGDNPAIKGECAFNAGRLQEAEAQFHISDHPLAWLRLGDLALRRGDPTAAAKAYRQANRGVFGRMARARTCELEGDCFDRTEDDRTFDPVGMESPLFEELTMRAARKDALLGQSGRAAQRMISTWDKGACKSALSLCRRIALAALEDPSDAIRNDGLSLYVLLDSKGAYALPLARAAAEAAEAVGAPAFGAMLLSSQTPEVAPAELSSHLLRGSELFLSGNDLPRARVLFDFARTRLTSAQLRGARWNKVARALSYPQRDVDPKAHPKQSQTPLALEQGALQLEQSRALLAVLRARRQESDAPASPSAPAE